MLLLSLIPVGRTFDADASKSDFISTSSDVLSLCKPQSPYADFFREKEGIPLLEVKAHLEIPSAKDYQGMF